MSTFAYPTRFDLMLLCVIPILHALMSPLLTAGGVPLLRARPGADSSVRRSEPHLV